jgi:hypothetical protein
MKKLIFLLGTLFFVAVFVAGCRPSAVVVRDRPYPPHYVQPAAPGPNYVWVSGEWVRKGRGYAYHQGYWVAPARNHRHYITGHWQRRGHGWVWASGHWR